MRSLFLSLLLSGLACAQPITGWQSGLKFPSNPPPKKGYFHGDIQWVAAPGKFGKDHHLNIWRYLPPGYDAKAKKGYPVLYCCDGQNLFMPGGLGGDLGLDELLEENIPKGFIPPIIVIGIDDGASGAFRFNYYTAHKLSDPGDDPPGGKAAEFATYLRELKPRVDKTFNTEPQDSAILGESLGGLFAIYAGFAHQDVFSRAAALSPSLRWGTHPGTGELISSANLKTVPKHLWIDMGDDEKGDRDTDKDSKEYVDLARQLDATIRKSAPHTADNFHFEIVKGGEHGEPDWHARLPRVLAWLYKK